MMQTSFFLFSCSSLLLFLFSLLLFPCSSEEKKIPLQASQFNTTVSIAGHTEIRYVDFENQRMRINYADDSSTLILADQEVSFFFHNEKKTCRKSSFFGQLQMEMMPATAVFVGRHKVRNENCDIWRDNGKQECKNYCIQSRIINTKKKKRRFGQTLDIPQTIIHHELPQPVLIFQQITIHEAGKCEEEPLRTIDFLDYLPGPQDPSLFLPPNLPCKSSSAQRRRTRSIDFNR